MILEQFKTVSIQQRYSTEIFSTKTQFIVLSIYTSFNYEITSEKKAHQKAKNKMAHKNGFSINQ